MRGLVTPRPVQRLVDELSRLPGIGPKSASRLTYFMLRAPEEQSRALADALLDLKAGTRMCSSCYNITAAEVDPCFICASAERDAGVLCVVEDPLDVAALERTRVFNGHYHVLHGAISPIDGVGPDDLRIRELIDRVRRGSVREVVLATNPNLAGEATAMYLHRVLASLTPKVTKLARGLPMGGDVEYADETTLARALEGRSDMSAAQ